MPPTVSKPADPRLRYELLRLLRVLRAHRTHREGAIVWGGLTTVALLLLASPLAAPSGRLVILPLFVIAAITASWLAWRNRPGLPDAIKAIEKQDPPAAQLVKAAVEQQPDAEGRFHFLQRRLFHETLLAANARDWVPPVRASARRWLLAHVGLMGTALVLSILVVRQVASPESGRTMASDSVEVTPGDVEVERGGSVLIAGRFSGTLPAGATLLWQPEGEALVEISMDRSLSDPVFAATLRDIRRSGVYQLRYDNQMTPAHRITVYELPALVRSDVSLDFPSYTGLPPRRIEDTRTISAVVGTALDLELVANKSIARASLVRPDGEVIDLEARDPQRIRFGLSQIVANSERFAMRLTDDAGRTNQAPPTLRIEALPNRRPELTLAFPKGDRRASPLEELPLHAEARDDFGLVDYGIALGIGNEDPVYHALGGGQAATELEAAMRHLLELEQHDVKPDQLVTWFAWADDIGPDGAVRRSTSDLAFIEIRPFDEVFRENATGSMPASGSGGGPGEELIEIQRHISIALWKLRQDATSDDYAERRQTLHESQQAAREQLDALRPRLDTPRARAAAEDAANYMAEAEQKLAAAGSEPAASRDTPLSLAWNAAQGAYQSLLRMQPRETQVAQSGAAGAGGGQRSQRQLDQLEFRNEADRYATETQATPPPTPEERAQLQVLARLRDLARRQQQLNERLQELQTALAAADDERREEIRRELKRLEDEQRRMLADLDETRQRVDQLQPGQRAQDARRQLDATRQDMQRSSEQLGEGEITQALAAGTRATEGLQQTGDQLRSEAAGRLGEQLREARRQARDLAEAQDDIQRRLDELAEGPASLDDSATREQLARQIEAQTERRNTLLDTLRQVTEDSEAAEPRLHRQLYDLVRDASRSGTEAELARGSQLLRRGFIEPVREPQRAVTRSVEHLRRAVDRAAELVLGDEANELRFAQRELDELAREIQQEAGTHATNPSPASAATNPSDGTPGGPGREETDSRASPASSNALTRLQEFAERSGGGRTGAGPLTGPGFAPWAERLRTVEDLMDDVDRRRQLAQARFEAEEARREFQRHGQMPRWDLVETGIVSPLREAQAWLQQELRRRQEPDILQPVDRDPVPERYAEAVRRYYEALGAE